MKKSMIRLSILLLSGGTSFMFGQVGINTTTPQATFDVKSKNPTGNTKTPEGLLIPKVDRQRALSMEDIQESTIIYVDNTSSGTATGKAANINAPGFYYFDNTLWQKLGTGSTAFQNMTGNVNSLSAATTNYTVQKSDYLIVTNSTGAGYVTIEFSPAGFTAADAGKTVWVYNDNASTGNAFTGISAVSPLVNNIARGIPFMWTGTKWVTVGK